MRSALLAVLAVLLTSAPALSLTKAELRFKTASKLNEDTTSSHRSYSNAQLNTWIEDAVAFISHVTLCVRAETTMALVVSQTDYTLSTNYIRTDGVVISSKGTSVDLDRSPIGLIQVVPSAMGKSPSGRTLPTHFQDLGEVAHKIRLGPSPTVVDTIRVSYFRYATILDTGNTCELPDAFQTCIPDFAAAESWGRNRLDNPYWNRFVEKMQMLVPTIQFGTEPEVPAAVPGGVK